MLYGKCRLLSVVTVQTPQLRCTAREYVVLQVRSRIPCENHSACLFRADHCKLEALPYKAYSRRAFGGRADKEAAKSEDEEDPLSSAALSSSPAKRDVWYGYGTVGKVNLAHAIALSTKSSSFHFLPFQHKSDLLFFSIILIALRQPLMRPSLSSAPATLHRSTHYCLQYTARDRTKPRATAQISTIHLSRPPSIGCEAS